MINKALFPGQIVAIALTFCAGYIESAKNGLLWAGLATGLLLLALLVARLTRKPAVCVYASVPLLILGLVLNSTALLFGFASLIFLYSTLRSAGCAEHCAETRSPE
jgi:hypothetical protein